jgi:two-component system, OmpR family, sensor kinase
MTTQLHPAEAPAQPISPPAPSGHRRIAALCFVLVALGPLILLALRLVPELDQRMFASPNGHAAITGGAALLGMALALLVTRAAIDAQDARALLIGLGLLSSAALFTIHAVSTPGVLLHGRGAVTGLSALLSLVMGGGLLALSGLNLRSQTNRWIMARARLWLVACLVFWLLASYTMLGGMVVTGPAPAVAAAGADHAASHTIVVGADVRGAITLLGVLCYGFAAWRHYRLYRRSPSRTGLAITCGVALFGLALVTQSQVGATYSLSFWLYHLQEFAGFGVISAAILAGYRSGQTDEGLLEGLFLSGTRARLRAGYASALEALIETLARGEQPDEALRRDLHARFGLAESQIQALEQAAGAVAQERRQRQELERLNDALLQMQRNKEQLTQMVVHDLKNPLTAMIGFLEIMRLDAGRLDETQRLLLDSALRSGKNLAGLIGDVLDAARLEEGRLELNYSILPLRDLLRDCAGEMGAWLIQDEKTIRIDAPDTLPAIIADRRLLRRVILNLISNAIKHTPSGTTITLRARTGGGPQAPDSLLVVEVEDNGPGIAPEHLAHIFDRFGRLSGETSGRQHSSGLGLTFCRLAVEAHGGALTVNSELGYGTIFRITMPVSNFQGKLEPPASLPATATLEV